MSGRRSRRYHQYRREVWQHTDQHHPPRAGQTRQHHVPISRGFAWGIPPNLIGGRANVSYMTLQENIAQGTRIDERGRENLHAWGLGHRLQPTSGQPHEPPDLGGTNVQE